MSRAFPDNHSPAARRLRALLVALLLGLAGGVVVPVLVPAAAQAHVERPSYFPNPKPDRSVSRGAGGKGPTERSLASALDDSQPGRPRVVCQPDSLDRLKASVAA